MHVPISRRAALRPGQVVVLTVAGGCSTLPSGSDESADPPRDEADSLEPMGEPVEIVVDESEAGSCGGRAADELRETVPDRIPAGESLENVYFGQRSPAILIRIEVTEDGEVVDRPEIETDTLVHATPREVIVSTTDGEERCHYEPSIGRTRNVVRETEP